MNFDDVRRHRMQGFVRDYASRASLEMRVVSGESIERVREIGDLVALTTSRRKVQANRNNAKKSTGPKSARGKALASFNARKHGLFAVQRLIPGEDEKQYEQLSTRLIVELAPKCAIEGMLVDQIISDIWRLQRLDHAERAYLSRVQESVYERFLRSLPDREYVLLKQHVRGQPTDRASAVAKQLPNEPQVPDSMTPDREDAGKTQSRFDTAVSRSLECKLERVSDLGFTLLEGIVDPNRAFAYTTLDQIRRSLVRSILRKYGSLGELQGQRPMIRLQPAED